jgi:hypothetical protein
MWPDFERAWSEPILRQSIARQVWSALTEEERRLAIKAARGYVIHRRSQKKPPNTVNAHTFLRERDAWVGFAALAPSEPRRTETITITEGSAAWRGLSVIKRIWDRPLPDDPVDVEATAIPALESLARLAAAAERCVITESDHRAQVAAWRERLAKCGFRMPQPQPIDTGKVHPVLGPVRMQGWTVPALWPPRMDGTLSATGPPAAQPSPPTTSR